MTDWVYRGRRELRVMERDTALEVESENRRMSQNHKTHAIKIMEAPSFQLGKTILLTRIGMFPQSRTLKVLSRGD